MKQKAVASHALQTKHDSRKTLPSEKWKNPSPWQDEPPAGAPALCPGAEGALPGHGLRPGVGPPLVLLRARRPVPGDPGPPMPS